MKGNYSIEIYNKRFDNLLRLSIKQKVVQLNLYSQRK